MSVWRAINRAAKACFATDAVTTHLCVADDPAAMAMRGTGWRLRIAPDGITTTHGALPVEDLRWITDAIRTELDQIDMLPDDWHEGWAEPVAEPEDPEDDPSPF